MIRPVNPAHLLPVYLGLPERAKRGHLLCPTTALPAIQFKIDSATGPTVTAFDVVDDAGGVVSQNTALMVRTPFAGAAVTFYSYSGATLTNSLPAGTKQYARFTMSNGAIYYSHALCPTNVFDADITDLSITSCSQPVSNQYTFTLTAVIPSGAGWSVLVEDDNSSSTYQAPTRVFTLNQTFGTEVTGAKSFTITVSASYDMPNGGQVQQVKVYRLTFTTIDPCGSYNLTDEGETLNRGETLYRLTIGNAGVDQQGLGCLYQDGWAHQLYFIGYDEQPDPVTQETYTDTAGGGISLQTALFRERYSLSFWPCPDETLTALFAQQYSVGTTLRAYAGATTTLARYVVAPIAIANEQVPGATLAVEVGGARVERCEENYV